MTSRMPPPPGRVLPIRPGSEDGTEPASMAGLVARIQAGSDSAMRELYDLVHDCAVPYLRWRLGSPGVQAEMDDRLHDTYLAAVEAIVSGTIREPERLMGFVKTVVRHQATAAIRRAVRRRKTDGPADGPELADQRPTPERSRMDAEQREMMHSLLGHMKPRDREILIRFYLDGHSQEQICADMTLTPTQFRLNKSRAKARFSTLALARLTRPVRKSGAA
ncbi:MAG TPA: sigma-70 family RNA polymerase sigma factor [Bryobacteraceae bacterium]|nr:sigma-70 family RNA polymerase sigma factor [Bryobacteraceae bacterium]